MLLHYIIFVYDMYEMFLFLYTHKYEFTIHNYGVINISYNILK